MNRLVSALGAALLLTSLLATPVAAADPIRLYNRVASADDPQAAYAALTPKQRRVLRDFLAPAKKERVTSVSAQQIADPGGGATCWRTADSWVAYNNVGWRIWSWNMRVEWCGNGTKVVDYNIRRWGETYVIFWSWKEVSFEKKLSSYIVPQRLYAFAQAEFKACFFADLGCTVYRYPWLEFRGWANGRFEWSY